MAQIFNGQRVRGVRVLNEGATLFNMMRVRGVRVASDGALFDGGRQTIGVDVLDQDRAIWNEQLVMGVVVITDDRALYNGMEILPAWALTGSLGAGVVPDPISALMWVGAYDDNSVTLTASAITGDDTVRFAALPVGGGAAVLSAPVAVDADYKFARATISGLSGEYTLQVRSAAGAIAPLSGKIKTRPAARQAFKIGFASCYWAGEGNNHPIFDTIIDQNPDMLAFYNLGDRGYADISTNSVALYHAADDTAMSLSRAARLHRSMPNLYMWDDHDYGANDSGASSASRAAAVSWFRSRVPMRPVLTGPTDAPYYAHSPMPGVTVAMLDTRSERSTGSAQMIGAGQEAWLIGLIEALPLGDVLVINASVPWVATAAADTWSIASAQRQRIADAVTANCPGQVFIIAGDMHALAYDNGTNSVGGIPVAQAAPLGNSNSSKGGPYSTGPIQATQHQYGTLVFTPTADGWTVRFEGWSVDDAGVQTRRIDQTATLEPPVVVDPPAGDAPVLVQTALSPQDATGQVTSVTVDYAQPAEGNLLVAMFGAQSTSLVIPDIAGWNVASYHTGTGFRHKAYWKFAGASEPTSVTQEVSSGSPRSLSGQVMEFGNVAAAYNLLVDTDGSLSATTGLDLGPHSALENAISVAFTVYDIAGASETTSTGPGADFTSTLNARSNANQRFGAKISSAAENVTASFTLAAAVRSGRTLLTFNPVAPADPPEEAPTEVPLEALQPAVVLNTTDSLDTYTASSDYNVEGGSGRVLLAFVQVCQGGSSTAIAATANGAAMTPIVQGAHSAGGSRPSHAVFAIDASASGLRTIVASVNPAGRSCTIVCAELTGANIAALVGASVTREAISSPPDRTLTPTASGSLLFGVQSTRRGDGSPFTPLAGVTEIADLSTGTTATNDHSAFVGSRLSVGTAAQEVGGTDAVGSLDTLFSAVEILQA